LNSAKPKVIDFFNFIYERHLLFLKKNVYQYPQEKWTNDPILQKHKFCNVYRELDKGTQVLIRNILENKNLNLEDKIFNILLYRRFNTVDFFDRIPRFEISKFNWKELERKMDADKKRGIRLFNDAYIVCQRKSSTYRPHDKHVQQLLLIDSIKDKINIIISAINSNRISEVHECLKKIIPMTGDFLAYQYCTDISYIPELWNHFEDINTFVAMGPGSKPGIDLLFPNRNGSYESYCQYLFDMQEFFFNLLAVRKRKFWSKIYYQDAYYQNKYLSLSNIQNCLCEYRKYIFLQINPNKKKRYYRRSE